MRSVLQYFGFRPVGKHISYYLQFLHWLCHLFVVVACRGPALLHSCRLNLANPISKFLRKTNVLAYSELREHIRRYVIEIQRSINLKDSKNKRRSHCVRSMNGVLEVPSILTVENPAVY